MEDAQSNDRSAGNPGPAPSKVKVRVAVIAAGLNIGLTVFKFLAYRATGSVAVLADAWHSFADIATSSFVVLCLIRAGRDETASLSSDPRAATSGRLLSRFRGFVFREYTVAFGIGLFLLFVSVAVLAEVARSADRVLENSLPVGLLFIVFSFCSYCVYRYETHVGHTLGSMGLVADGMHSKADMVAAMLTGFSLVLYRAGVNVDRPLACLIGLFVFATAIETMTNAVLAATRKQATTLVGQYRLPAILGSLLEPANWGAVAATLRAKLNAVPGAGPACRRVRNGVTAVILLLAGWGLMRTCFYAVGPAQEGIVERFGRPVEYGCSSPPGLHLKFPWPIDKVVLIDSKAVRTANVGNVAGQDLAALLWTREHGYEEPFLSSDNCFFYPYIVVNYAIKDVFAYTYRHQFPDELIRDVANRMISRVFVTKLFYDIATVYRMQLEIDVAGSLQGELDQLECGIEIVDVYFKDIHPPIPIAPSFEKVVAAAQEKERMINNARGYENETIPAARGDAVRMAHDAAAYADGKIQSATGETTAIGLRLEAYESAKAITRKRLHLEAMKAALAEKRKILVDPASGTPDLWMGFGPSFSGEDFYQ